MTDLTRFRHRRRRILEPILALAISMPLAGALDDCQKSSVRGCPQGPTGNYEMVFDFESTSQRFECDGSETVTAELSATETGFEVTYLDVGPFPVTVDGDTFEWTESATREGVTTIADYSISVTDCVIRGDGLFSRQFDGGSCSGVVSISGSKATP